MRDSGERSSDEVAEAREANRYCASLTYAAESRQSAGDDRAWLSRPLSSAMPTDGAMMMFLIAQMRRRRRRCCSCTDGNERSRRATSAVLVDVGRPRWHWWRSRPGEVRAGATAGISDAAMTLGHALARSLDLVPSSAGSEGGPQAPDDAARFHREVHAECGQDDDLGVDLGPAQAQRRGYPASAMTRHRPCPRATRGNGLGAVVSLLFETLPAAPGSFKFHLC